MLFDINTLVDLVVVRARVDKTVPNRRNLRSGWLTDTLLTIIIDALVVGEYNDPTAYAKIARRVLERLQDLLERLPEMEALAMLAILRGERLLPLTSEQVELVTRLSEDLKSAISALLKGTRKQRCLELYSYHMGVFYDTLCYFDLAVEMYKWAVREAGSRSSSAAISRYCAALSRLKQALRVGKPAGELEALFSDLEERFAQLAEALKGSELEVQYVEGNCPVQMITACIWLNRRHPEWDDWVATALAAAEKLGGAWEPGAEFVRAAYMERCDDPQATKALEAIAANNDNPNEIRATALLLLARRAFRAGNVDEAKKIIEQMPEQGAQHVRAIAEHMVS